jgi:alcohol dehydrogenase class IV
MAGLRAAGLIASALDGPDPDRPALALGALLAAYASGSAGYAVHHVVCQTIVRVGGTPHAETNATMLPHSVRLMRERAPEVMAQVEEAIGPDPERLAGRAEVSTLTALGFDRERVDDVVEAVLPRPELANTPNAPDADELRAFVEGAL